MGLEEVKAIIFIPFMLKYDISITMPLFFL